MKTSVLVVLALVQWVQPATYVDVRCTADICKEYVEQEGCPKLPSHCTPTNLALNPDAGILLPAAITCNCCDTCLTYQKAGTECVLGSVDQPLPMSICGPGLTCALVNPTDEDAVCVRIDSVCTRAQDKWDEMREDGTLGSHISRPECDARGMFIPAHCIPGLTCYCVAPDGTRIQGEIPLESDTTAQTMFCPCSLNEWRASKVFSGSKIVSRCAGDGRFDALQCVDNKCFCVKVDDGTLAGKQYAHVTDLKEGALPCFDPLIHADGMYFKPCEEARFNAMQKLGVMLDDGVIAIGPRAPKCDAAGDYSSTQDLGTTKVCVDPTNEKLEDFEVSKSSPGAKSMNCNCARTRWMLRSLIDTGHAVELPKCCANGNYEAWQCRRGLCYCVDDDGNQLGVESAYPEQLTECYKPAGPCATVSS